MFRQTPVSHMLPLPLQRPRTFLLPVNTVNDLEKQTDIGNVVL